MAPHILLVDDDALLRRSLAFNLERSGYRVSASASAEDGLSLAQHDRPDLVLLDIGLPGIDGLDALGRFQGQLHMPVIFLTARRRELDEVLGLGMGADDYITKPFDLDVLLARIKVGLRHSARSEHTANPRTSVVAGDLAIDPAAHTVAVAGRPVELPRREFDLLYTLVQEARHPISVEQLLARVWGAAYAGESAVVYVHIRWLREKLEANPNRPRRIITVRGVGYKLEPCEA